MTELWYYSEGGEARGPLSLAELVPLLSRMIDPRRVLIWRQGFDDWKPVEDVREIAQLVLRPPPLQHAPPPMPSGEPAPAIRQPAVDAEDASQFKDVKPELTGLGGWLILVGIGQVVGILRFVASLGQYYGALDPQFWTKFPLAMWGEAALNGALFGTFVYTAVLFFRRSRRFPQFFILVFVLSICAPLVAILWAGFAIGMASGLPMRELMTFDAKEGGQLAAVVIGAAIWIPYILKSQRVRNTFTR